jgi:hypothetical protein
MKKKKKESPCFSMEQNRMLKCGEILEGNKKREEFPSIILD